MSRRFLPIAAAALALWPAAARADHVSVAADVTASIVDISPDSVKVRVGWLIACQGEGSAASFTGNLNLVELVTEERIYLGGVSSESGKVRQLVGRTERDRSMSPELTVSCSKTMPDNSIHGSDTVTVRGAGIVIPAKEDGGGGGGGGGGGDSGGGGGGGDPDEPLVPGGCAVELLGTPKADRLEGGAASELVLAFGGADRVRGRAGHDCLIGAGGRDRLLGEEGSDRLTGGTGGDRLTGGPGRNAYDAGSGKDRIDARNGTKETIRCGPGKDSAKVDADDRVRDCERVQRP